MNRFFHKFFSARQPRLKNRVASAQTAIPQHIAIIMDGNGRWARARHLPRVMGHRAGIESIRRVLNACENLGVRFLTLYAFSTENWKRPPAEVGFLMKLLQSQLRRELAGLHEKNVRILTIGGETGLPASVCQQLALARNQTRANTGITLVLALNYGARQEILQAAQSLAADVLSGRCELGKITETDFQRYLYTAQMPDPDLLIRTSGEMRLSNFLLWQCSYTELFMTEKYWPDFAEDDLLAAVAEYQRRNRRFGGVTA